ncbi:MAG: RNA 2',3'-cyclic phosphodiesterase [Candidatus Wildermuthbacteria bacterium]|nr:RNA 2',3'-cyclic phosphodiesterase [Candidatus Wildermuthbacteria bacterium]
MLHRIFIAINLPERIKEKLLEYKNKWPELPARWTTKENLHLTLAFLGNTSDQELVEVCALLERVGERHNPFSLAFTKITYGPLRLRPGQAPKMIWAIGEKSTELLALQNDIGETPEHEASPLRQGSSEASQPFSPHLTLARLKTFELQRMELEEIPDISEEISLSFEAQSMEIMESQLKRSGSQYTVLQSIPLGNN